MKIESFIFRVSLIFVCMSLQLPSNAKDIWMQIDHNGHLYESEQPDPVFQEWLLWRTQAPLWDGWTVRPANSGCRPTTRYDWIKEMPDGSTIVVSFSSTYNPLKERIQCHQENSPGVKTYGHGFVDNKGSVAINPIYQYTLPFQNGLAAVLPYSEDRWLLIDKRGRTKFTLPAEYAPMAGRSDRGISKEGVLAVVHGKFLGTSDEVGVYDFKNKEYRPVGKVKAGSIGEFHEGLASYSPSIYKMGFINLQGEVVIPAIFNWTENFKDGLAVVRTGYKWDYINRSGKIVIDPPDDCSYATSFNEGMAAIALGGNPKDPNDHPFTVRKNAKWAFIDTAGKIVIPAQFTVRTVHSAMRPDEPIFREGLAAVSVGNQSKLRYGYIDKAGTWVIKPKFKMATPFQNGKGRVLCDDETAID